MDHRPGDLLIVCGWNWMILKWSDRWLCSQAWRSVGLLNPVPDSCDQETSHNIITYSWPDMKSYISISLDIWDVSIYAFGCSNLQAWFNKKCNHTVCVMWTEDSSSFKYNWHWYFQALCVCVYFFLVITVHGMSGSIKLLRFHKFYLLILRLKDFNFWL